MQFLAGYKIVATDNFANHFHPEHLADLRKSGLTDETIQMAGVYSIAPGDINRFFRQAPDEVESALCFPYQGGSFARIKLFPALGKMKYSQPPRTGARLYVPHPVTDHGPLWVVEGEKKTLAAIQIGEPAVGIGGVWNWLSDGEPIADIQLVDWSGREVTIVPDSDVFRRTDLLRAIYALGREIQALGAEVLVAQIPQDDDSAKVGLDDFLVAGGDTSEIRSVSLGSRELSRLSPWYSQWKIKKAMKASQEE